MKSPRRKGGSPCSDDRTVQIAHERLEAYVVAREFLALAHEVARKLPRGEAAIADQLERAASSVLLNTAEGAGRRASKEKARFFDIARGSAAECAAILDVLDVRELSAQSASATGRSLLHRAVRLLAGLARSALVRSG